ncbi:MAG TPA: hypothetical protein VIF57_23650 [Polyangia bacterium]|jgi:hypothetical protein
MKWNQRLVRFSFDDSLLAERGGDWDAALAFWEGRGFRCASAGADRVVGRRGDWFGNLFSFDVQRLICDLDLRRESARGWSIRLLLEGAFQYFTEWNLGELVLEPLLFRRAMLGLPMPPDLARYRAETRRASVVSALSLTLAGKRLPEFWRQLFRQLAAPYDPPIVERVRV